MYVHCCIHITCLYHRLHLEACITLQSPAMCPYVPSTGRGSSPCSKACRRLSRVMTHELCTAGLAGEKQQRKREGKLARRAARAAAHGLDLLALSQQMAELIDQDGDMAAVPLVGSDAGKSKAGMAVLRKLATLYGLKSSFQVGRACWLAVRRAGPCCMVCAWCVHGVCMVCAWCVHAYAAVRQASCGQC
jgi:hypothetical protein